MNRFRPLLSAVLGLVLLVQGFAVAATEYRLPQASQMASEQAPPCHGQAQDQRQDQADSAPASCCDSGCPNMTSCVLSHLAAAPAASPALVITAEFPFTEPAVPRSSSPPPVFLRPPIVSHV